ncbi:MAG: adenylate/guanylate cyclase domain-containing protein [Nitrospirota bacterium]
MISMEKLKQLAAPTGFKIGLIITVLSLLIYGLGIPFLNVMELKAYDLHFLSRGTVPPGNEVVIVGIDEKSVDGIGRWPWPRTRIADLINRLGSYGAKVVAFDILFSEPDESSGVAVVRDLKERFGSGAMKAALEKAEQETDNDAKLATALRKNQSVILGYFFFMSREEVKHRTEKKGDAAAYHIPGRYTSVRSLEKGSEQPRFPTAREVEQNIPVLAKAASDFGYFNIVPDSDGTVRWVPLAIKFGDDVYPHISVEAVRRYLGSPPTFVNTASYGVDSISIGKLQVPTDEEGRLLINFRGPQKTFPHYSFIDVLNGTAPASAFKDKIVLVGATAIGIYDMRVIPFSGTFPGIEIHANIIDNILRNDPISRPDWVTVVDVITILLCGICLSLAISRIRALFGTLVTIGLIFLYAFVNEYVFVAGKVWLTAVYPGMTMVFVFFGVTTYRFMTEEKKKREIKEAFSHYVAPSLVNNILQDPTKLVLGGEERRLTVLFSDIRGFTTISESLSPQALVKLMNDYLTPMTDIVLKHGGTIDKYMGDAIMAFWGAPVWQEDHQARACRAALEMLEKLAVLQVEWEKQGIPHLDIGVGISTGKLTVGNMGSTTRFDYTVMGDSVNLGSRLEGLNKEYGTHIIVPKYTYEDVKNDFILRQLDLIRVKGKNIPIKIYELMGITDSGRLREIAGLSEAGLKAYTERDWDKAEKIYNNVIHIRPEDGPAAAFLERIKHLRQEGVPADWDGVYVMKKK